MNITITVDSWDELETLANKIANRVEINGIPTIEELAIAAKVPVQHLTGQHILENPESDENETLNTEAPAADKTGLPWDERIHAGSRALNKDGTWKKRKGVQELQVTQVEAELRARAVPVAAPVAPQPFPAFAPVAPVAPQPVPVAPQPIPVPQPVQPAMPVQPQPFEDFQNLVNTVNGLFASQKIGLEQLNQFNGQMGISAITDLQGSPERIVAAFQQLRANGWIA